MDVRSQAASIPASTGQAHDPRGGVEVLHWPAEGDRRRECGDRQPRLLLVAPDAPAPDLVDDLEDWVRLPASPGDVDARIRALERRAQRTRGGVSIDADGVCRVGEGLVTLPPVEARLATALVERIGAVVSRDALGHAGWAGDPPGRNALDVHMVRLRRRLAAVGLTIRTVRSRGYLLEPPARPDAGATVPRRVRFGSGT